MKIFTLKYKNTIIGELKYNDIWTFQYVKGFEESSLSPLFQFPDINKIYKSNSLFIFFDMRIPPLHRIEEEIEKESLNKDKATLLERFGKKTINNPYILERKNHE